MFLRSERMEIKKRDQLIFPSHMTSVNPKVTELKGGLFSKNREKESVGSVTRARDMGLTSTYIHKKLGKMSCCVDD